MTTSELRRVVKLLRAIENLTLADEDLSTEACALADLLEAPRRQTRKTVRAKRAGGRQANTSAVYLAVEARANGMCECGCGKPLAEVPWLANPVMDHFEGRARSESVETCWMLRRDCNQERTENKPDARTWLEKFMRHCRKHSKDYLDQYHAAHDRARDRIEGMVASREREQERRK